MFLPYVLVEPIISKKFVYSERKMTKADHEVYINRGILISAMILVIDVVY